MNKELQDAVDVCQRWFDYLDRQKQDTITLQKAAALARKGDRAGAMRLKANVDNQPKVYDGATLLPAVKTLIAHLTTPTDMQTKSENLYTLEKHVKETPNSLHDKDRKKALEWVDYEIDFSTLGIKLFENDPNKIDLLEHNVNKSNILKTIRQALQCQSGWMPIETAPKDGTEIIITNGYEVYTGKYKKSNITNYAPYFCKSCDGGNLNDGHDWQDIPIYMHATTHWMPLPQPPKEK